MNGQKNHGLLRITALAIAAIAAVLVLTRTPSPQTPTSLGDPTEKKIPTPETPPVTRASQKAKTALPAPAAILSVIDTETMNPVAGAFVSWGTSSVNTDANGFARLPDLPAETILQIKAKGYHSISQKRGKADQLPITLDPWRVELEIIDSATGTPLTETLVRIDGHTIQVPNGTATLRTISEGKHTLWITKPGYVPWRTKVEAQGTLPLWNVEMEPYVVSGTITDAATGAHLPDVAVTLSEQTKTTDANGNYAFTALPSFSEAASAKTKIDILATKDGYRPQRLLVLLEQGATLADISLEPIKKSK